MGVEPGGLPETSNEHYRNMAPVSTLSFKCALITGGGGGIGRGMAEALIALGKSVIIAGRMEANLKKTATEIGARGYVVFDVSTISRPSLTSSKTLHRNIQS